MQDFENRNVASSTDLQIDWLRAFVHALDAGSLVAAGRILHRSPAAMSMKLKKLEQAVGRPLLQRDSRGLSLTDCGATLLPHARAVLAAHRSAREAAAAPALRGAVRLGIPDDYASAYLSPLLRQYASLHPGVEVTLACAQSTVLIPQLGRGELDVALVTRDRADRGHLLFHEPMIWVGAGDCWRRDPLPIAVFEPGALARTLMERALRRIKRSYRIAYESSSTTGQIAAVQSGLAVAALSRCSKPEGLATLDERHGLPALRRLPVAVVLARGARRSAPARRLHEQAVRQLEKVRRDAGRAGREHAD